MTTAELIAKLQETDPTGEAEVFVNAAHGYEFEIEPAEPFVHVEQVYRGHEAKTDKWWEWDFDEPFKPSYIFDRIEVKHAVVVG